MAEGQEGLTVVDAESVPSYLGPVKFFSEVAERTSEPGVATGLAWTPTGGDILFIEATRMKGRKGFTLTGQLGEVMKESAQAALSYVRAKAKTLKIPENFFDAERHPHPCPRRGHPQGRPVCGGNHVHRHHLSAHRKTGPQRCGHDRRDHPAGLVLPVGGIKEKVLAARRCGHHHRHPAQKK